MEYLGGGSARDLVSDGGDLSSLTSTPLLAAGWTNG